MSTRITVVYQEPFHLYFEVFDDDNIYLEYEEDGKYTCMCIPIETWEKLRKGKVEG